jgi:uncharacterized protein (DUF305 family)
MKKYLTMVAVVAVALAGYLAFTQIRMDHDMSGMAKTEPASAADASASIKAFESAMSTMMGGMTMPPTGIPDVDFANGMIPHHQGAIEMAKVAKQFAKDPELLKLADGIIAAQESEITVMKDWLSKVGQSMTEKVPDSIKPNEAAMATMMKEMHMPYTGNADLDFARSMIPHHQSAIDMAKVVLQYGKDPDMRKLAEGVVKAQEEEIAFMKQWLVKNPS